MYILPCYSLAGELLGYVNSDDVLVPVPVAIANDPNVSPTLPLTPMNQSPETSDRSPSPIHVECSNCGFRNEVTVIVTSNSSNSSNSSSNGNGDSSSSSSSTQGSGLDSPTQQNFDETQISPDEVLHCKTQGFDEPIWKTKLNCDYCMRNGEEEVFYKSHAMRDSRGRTMCPILASTFCPACNATGIDGHTLQECPDKCITISSSSSTSPPHSDDFDNNAPDEIVKMEEDNTVAVQVVSKSAVGYSQIGRDKQGRQIRCVYCRYRKNCRKYYRSHRIRDDEGFVSCPVLSREVCQMCGATGKLAHTLDHCPQFEAWKNSTGVELEKKIEF